MLKISGEMAKECRSMFETHRLYINTCNIYFQTIRMLNHKTKFLKREDYELYYKNTLNDIELESPPIDSFVPNDSEDENADLFVVNRLVPEYVKIKDRITLENLLETLPATNEASMKLKSEPGLLDVVIDDMFIHYSTFKYLDQINYIRLNDFSIMTPLIEYIVQNITLSQLKDFLVSRRINEEKYEKYCRDYLFNSDVAHTQKFYDTEHDDIPAIDVVQLMMKLTTNLVVESDIYIIIGIYLILSFAKSDIYNGKVDDSPCVVYVRDVLSKL